MIFFKSKWLVPEVIFVIILLAFGVFYNYHEIAFFKPVGIHQWRNSVCAAFPVNFYFGVHVFWFRMLQVAIGFTGLVYLFKACYFFTRDWFYAGPRRFIVLRIKPSMFPSIFVTGRGLQTIQGLEISPWKSDCKR